MFLLGLDGRYITDEKGGCERRRTWPSIQTYQQTIRATRKPGLGRGMQGLKHGLDVSSGSMRRPTVYTQPGLEAIRVRLPRQTADLPSP
jgi:hypothetical protein